MKTYWRAPRLSRLFLVSASLVPLLVGAQAVKPATSPASPSTSVADVEVDHVNQHTLVRVIGSGKLSYHITREFSPSRVVVDFDDARLTVARHAIPGESEPVHGVRLGQFTADQVRLVIDLTRPSAFSVDNSGATLVMTFADTPAASGEGFAAPAVQKTQSIGNAAPPAASARLVSASTGASTRASAREYALPASLTSRAAVLASPRPQTIAPQATSAANLPQTNQPLAARPAIANAALPEPAQGAVAGQAPNPNQRFTGEPISVNLKDVDLKDFFRLIHEISGLNVVLDPSVHGTVTLVLDEVPWDQALDIVLRNNGLAKEIDGNVLRIVTQDTLRKEADDQSALEKAQSNAVEPVTATRVLSYAKASDLVIPLRRFLSPRGDILAQDRNNMLIIRDIPAVMPKVDDLIRQLDRKTQQVEIEARVVQASRSFARDIGTQFGFAVKADPQTVIGGVPTAGLASPISHPISQPPPLVNSGTTSIPLVSNFPAVAPTSGLALAFSGKNLALDLLITAAENKGMGKLLSSPRLVTQNNATAVVKQGTQIPIQTTVNNTISTQYIDAVLKLQVTPQITADGTVFMDVLVENTQVDNGIPLVNGIPALSTQSAQTKVLIGDGGTVVVGGVMFTSQNTTVNQVPLLGSIPLIGHLFKETSVSVQSQELLFFITPRIMPD
jgi:type IV pilus assembly protein PilQ